MDERIDVYREGIMKTIAEITEYTYSITQNIERQTSGAYDARKLCALSAQLYAYVVAYNELKNLAGEG